MNDSQSANYVLSSYHTSAQPAPDICGAQGQCTKESHVPYAQGFTSYELS